MKNLLQRFKKNVLTQLFTFGFIMGSAGLLSNWYDWIYPVFVVCSIILTFYVLVFTIAGFVNLIKDALK
jgi:hypothetical protein